MNINLQKYDYVNLLHMLVVTPLFYALAENKVPMEYRKNLLYALAIIVFVYHMNKLCQRRS